MNTFEITAIIFAHWSADFVLQSDWMARNKSKRLSALFAHGAAYTAVMIAGGPLFAVVNGIIHTGIDYITSRRTAALWARGEFHGFFVLVGFDQALHLCTLMVTATLLW